MLSETAMNARKGTGYLIPRRSDVFVLGQKAFMVTVELCHVTMHVWIIYQARSQDSILDGCPNAPTAGR